MGRVQPQRQDQAFDGMTNTRVEPDNCPYCDEFLNAITPGPGNPHALPSPGDITLCMGCCHVLVFDRGMKVRKPTTQEALWAMADPQVAAITHAMRQLKKDTL